jgi:dolichol-phosphate mannosyltransferase
MTMMLAVFKGVAMEFSTAQAVASLTAMIFSFTVNNLLTYRDRRLTGTAWIRGLASFMLTCSVGAFANVGIASCLFGRSGGWVLAAMAGILAGAVRNYAVTLFYPWGNPRKK